MKDKFALSDFKQWRDNFTKNPNLPSITDNAIIQKKDLVALLADMNAMGADSAKVYFLRFKMNGVKPQKKKKLIKGKEPVGCKWIKAGNNVSQIAIAITPTKNFKIDSTTYIVSATDMPSRGKITLLIPGGRKDGPGGHNPPQPPPQPVKVPPGS